MHKPLIHSQGAVCSPTALPFESAALSTASKPKVSSDRFVPQLVSACARQNPGRIALADDSMQLTYGELDTFSSRLADQLQRLRVAADVVVAVCMRRSVLTAVAALAVLKAGGTYLPVDPNYPRERLSFILTDANAVIVLSDSTVSDRLPGGRWRLILLDRNADGMESAAIDWRASGISADQLAYVIYTSGSTGTPKGVGITHQNLLNLVSWHQKAFAVTPDDRATQFASFGFDAAVWELWPHLSAGAAVHITPEEIRSSPELLRDWLINQEITISFVPTALAERLIMLDWPSNTKLRYLLTGADTLHHYPRPGLPFELINNYGPTEATVVATSGRVATHKQTFEQRPNIGRPIDGTQIYIVDESLNPVPPGEVGEICVAGAGVAKGYVNSPELTAKKFVPDPFTQTPGGRLFRTGDVARWLPDGQIEYLGRVDDLIKIRGYRVEPNEIVTVLNSTPGVEASAVVARDDAAGNLSLVAYLVTSHSQTPPSAIELRRALRERLPEYMVPALFVTIPELPFTANGKLDREALPVPQNNCVLRDDNYVAPHTVLQEKLSSLVAGLLGVDRVGINDNFFLIGGHSLFGTQLIASIRDKFGVELPLRSIFESPTPALLAQQVERLFVTRLESMSEDEIRNALQQARSDGHL